MEAQELLNALESITSRNGCKFSAMNSNGQLNVTFAVVTQHSPRRVAINRSTGVALTEALAAGVTVALANLPE